MKWFRRKPEPTVTAEERRRELQSLEEFWQRDNPLKVYRVSFMDDRHPVEIRARRHMLIDDEYVFRNPGSRSEALCGWHSMPLVAVIPVHNVRAIEVTDADEADDQQ